MKKDWTGNKAAAFSILGASNHSKGIRETNDYYATDPKAVDLLLEQETFSNPIWECACGEGHLSKRLKEHGYEVISSDLVDSGYGVGNVDFLQCTEKWEGNIITNPPCKQGFEAFGEEVNVFDEKIPF